VRGGGGPRNLSEFIERFHDHYQLSMSPNTHKAFFFSSQTSIPLFVNSQVWKECSEASLVIFSFVD